MGLRRLLIIAIILFMPALAFAQEATLVGTVTDSTGGVLPGVTVRAVHDATGNTFETVTDERGNYRIPARTGTYRVTADLSGFTPATKGTELLVGAEVRVNLQLAPGSLQESVTVTSEAPLVDTTTTRVAGNVDPRQMQELPVNGRNFLDLTMMAPGSRMNAVVDVPAAGNGNFQINVDGQQVTQEIAGGGFGNPGYSKDAIAEFEYVANRFDATQGRSAGVQVNVVTKSGTNNPAGSISGFFRNSRFNAADFVQKRVLPYSDQQVATTFGGPIKKDKIHFFVNYEYEREPQTFTYSTPFPFLNVSRYQPHREDKEGLRLDFQFSPQMHFSVRGYKYDQRLWQPSGTNFTQGTSMGRHSNSAFGVLTQVLSSRLINEVKGGWEGFWFSNDPIVRGTIKLPELPGFTISPGLTFTGLTIGQTGTIPARPYEDNYSVRDDFTYSRGGHTLKTGSEFIFRDSLSYSCRTCGGVLDMTGARIPANLQDILVDPLDATTWKLDQLSSLARSYTIAVGNFRATTPQKIYAGWAQDSWAATKKLTLDLGLRYDVSTNLFGNTTEILPFIKGGRPNDTNNLQPRLGAAFTLNDRTVIRGGFGRYYSQPVSTTSWFTTFFGQTATVIVNNDGRPNFGSSPFNGPIPTYAQAVALKQRVTFNNNLSNPDEHLAYSWQGSFGFQRQVGSDMSINSDYVFTGTRDSLYSRNINLTYNPATGANYSFQDLTRLPFPDFGPVVMSLNGNRSNLHAVETVFNKRMTHRWQMSANWTLSYLKDGDPLPEQWGVSSGQLTHTTLNFPIQRDLGGEYTYAVNDQRNRAVVNGIWQLPYDFQVSGLYFYASGLRFATTWGGDLRATGGGGSARLRADGTIVPRNDFVGKPLHRVDLRLQRQFRFGPKVRATGLVELFNVFNHANYGGYSTAQSLANFGQPTSVSNVAYYPREAQLGFRFTF
jgi:Carboxypeptidase regulatory-like domain/TonB dependent receptor